MWRYVGTERPPFAHTPGPQQESVWDYPRPPRCELDTRSVQVFVGKHVIASTRQALRVLETASPPTFYLPPSDIDMRTLEPAAGSSSCEWKGLARYWSVRVGDSHVPMAAWSYPAPHAEYEKLRDYVAFYPGRVACLVDGEHVKPQPGRFYAGWITAEVIGPFKGEPGSEGW